MNPVCQSLVEAIGLSNTYRTLSALTLIIGIPCCLVFKQPIVYGDEDQLIDNTIETPVDEFGERLTPQSQFSTNPSENSMNSKVKNFFKDVFRSQTPVMTDPDITADTLLCGCHPQLWTDRVFILYMFGQLMKGIGYVFPFIHLVSNKMCH